MMRVTTTFIAFATVLGLCAEAQALKGAHAEFGLFCTDCHNPHPDPGYKMTEECIFCHNPTGLASTLAEVAVHSSATTSSTYGTWEVQCGACHDPHGNETGLNLSYIRQRLVFDTATTPVSFVSRPDDFVAAASPWNGVCEACHTQTRYYRRNGTQPVDHGQNGETCTNCHKHTNGFAASCLDCHDLPQGPRRAVVGEFAHITNNHAHLSNADGNVAAADCVVCHDQTTHMDGSVDLVDPDDPGILYTFVTASDLVSDPDLSDFCINCHDADGATRLATPLNPFASGNVPPDIKSKFAGTASSGGIPGSQLGGYDTPNSHHDITDADQATSGGKIECTNCHNAHTASAATKLADPNNLTQVASYTTVADKVTFCLACHDNAPPPNVTMPATILDQSGWQSQTGDAWHNSASKVHGGATMRGVGFYGYLNAPHDRQIPLGVPGKTAVPVGGITLACDACHDPHGSSYTDRSWNGNVYALRNEIDPTYQQYDNGAEDGIGRWLMPRTPFIPPTATYTTTVRQDPTDDTMTGFCTACHSVGPRYHFFGLCFGCHNGHRKNVDLNGSF